MKLWAVGICDCESNSTSCVCATKEIAVRELFKIRDKLVDDWKRMDEYSQERITKFCEKGNHELFVDDSFKNMIKNLSSDDYNTWKNYPHECPYIYEIEVISE